MTTAEYQGMSLVVMAKLLTLVQGYDRKFTFEDADVLLFHKVAVEYRWTAHEAEQAIHKWGATEADQGFMSPAKMNAVIRANRQDAMQRQPVAAPEAAPSAVDTRQRIMAMWNEAARDAAREKSRRRRELVAKHSDLIEEFNKIGFRRFETWSGALASPTVPSSGEGADGPTTDVGHGYQRNTSPILAELNRIVAEAERREAT